MTGASKIIIVGLGPGDPAHRTIGAQKSLDQADAIVLRTRIHPGLEDLVADPRVSDCDDLYASAADFDALYPAISERVINLAAPGRTVVFAVPGHPRYAERSVPLIEGEGEERGIKVTVLDGVSFVDTAVNAMRSDPVKSGLQILDALNLATVLDEEPFAAGQLDIDPTRPILVSQVFNSEIAATVKLALSRIYPDEQSIVVLQGAGILGKESLHCIELRELDRHDVDHLTSVWIAPMAPLAALRTPDSLARIVARLRAPGGCPWDREQTHASLRNAVLAEAYETVDAIDAGDEANLAEELGDLLLLVAMHSQLAEEAGAFRQEDVYEAIGRKLIRRHPHVFGTVQAPSPEAVIATWESVKARERAASGSEQSGESRYDRLPRSMPAMRKAIEFLAPRTQFRPGDRGDGNEVLNAIIALLDRQIDPELALEASLRDRVDSGEIRTATDSNSRIEPGKDQA